MVHSAAVWVYRALELPALTRRENAVGRRGRDQFRIGSGAGSGLVPLHPSTRKSADPGFVRAFAPRICNQVLLKLPVEA